MLLSYGGPQAARFREAMDKDCEVILINECKLMTLDIDPPRCFNGIFYHSLKEYGILGDILCATDSYSGGIHSYINLLTPLTPQLYTAIAVELGSDPKRERHSYERLTSMDAKLKAAHGPDDYAKIDFYPYVMFETKKAFGYVRDGFKRYGVIFKYIDHMAEDLSYSTQRDFNMTNEEFEKYMGIQLE